HDKAILGHVPSLPDVYAVEQAFRLARLPAATRPLPGPLPDVGRHGVVPGRSVEPAGLPAGLVVVLVADAGQPVRDGPLVDVGFTRDAVEVLGRLLVGG